MSNIHTHSLISGTELILYIFITLPVHVYSTCRFHCSDYLLNATVLCLDDTLTEYKRLLINMGVQSLEFVSKSVL